MSGLILVRGMIRINVGTHGIKDQLLIPAPKRRDENSLWSVAGETMDNGGWWKQGKTATDEVAVFLQLEDVEGLLLIDCC